MRIAEKILQENNSPFINMFNLINNSSQVRIRSFIRSVARDYGSEIKGKPGVKSIPFDLSVLEIAALTSTSPECVERILFEMLDAGLLSYS